MIILSPAHPAKFDIIVEPLIALSIVLVGVDNLHRGDGRPLLRDGAGDPGGQARPARLELEAKSDAELRAGGESHVILQIGEGRKDTRRLQIHPRGT